MTRHEEHEHNDFMGFYICDATTPDSDGNPVDAVWIGYGGMEGKWLTNDEAKDLAIQILKTANNQTARLKNAALRKK